MAIVIVSLWFFQKHNLHRVDALLAGWLVVGQYNGTEKKTVSLPETLNVHGSSVSLLYLSCEQSHALASLLNQTGAVCLSFSLSVIHIHCTFTFFCV